MLVVKMILLVHILVNYHIIQIAVPQLACNFLVLRRTLQKHNKLGKMPCTELREAQGFPKLTDLNLEIIKGKQQKILAKFNTEHGLQT